MQYDGNGKNGVSACVVQLIRWARDGLLEAQASSCRIFYLIGRVDMIELCTGTVAARQVHAPVGDPDPGN